MKTVFEFNDDVNTIVYLDLIFFAHKSDDKEIMIYFEIPNQNDDHMESKLGYKNNKIRNEDYDRLKIAMGEVLTPPPKEKRTRKLGEEEQYRKDKNQALKELGVKKNGSKNRT